MSQAKEQDFGNSMKGRSASEIKELLEKGKPFSFILWEHFCF